MLHQRDLVVLAALAGAAAPLTALAQAPGPREHQGRTLRNRETQHFNRVLHPVRVRGIRLVGNEIEYTTDWMPWQAPVTDADTTPYFECAEWDISSGQPVPVGFCSGGCATVPGNMCPQTPDNRWWSGTAYVGPSVVNDMTVVSGANNAHATRAIVAANWGPTTATDLQLLIATAETFNNSNVGSPPFQPSSGAYAGVIADFGPQIGGPMAGYFALDADLTTMPALFYQMPADGSGAYILMLAHSATGGQITFADLETSASTQFMYWGTGDGETPNDGRPGHQGPNEWDDDAPLDGAFTANEFYSETGFGICPDPVGPMIAFYGPPLAATCYANCDASTTCPVVNTGDFTCFLQQYAAGQQLPAAQQLTHYANCDNSTTPPVINTGDFTCFLQKYAASCSGC